jgi:thiol-disulfide isomerase/thioredoxin
MKKNILFPIAIIILAIMAILFSRCNLKNEFAYTIYGKVPNEDYNGQAVYLQMLDTTWSNDSVKYITIDTVYVVDKEFIFKGLADKGAMLYFIMLDDAPDSWTNPIPVVVEPGDITVSFDSVSTIIGSSLNNEFQTYITQDNLLQKKINDLKEKVKNETDSAEKKIIKNEYDAIKKDKVSRIFDFAKNHIDTQVGVYLFIKNAFSFSEGQIKEILPLVSPKYTPKVQKIRNYIKALDNTAEGKFYIDIEGVSPDGQKIALSDYIGKGKYVLINFWASWDGPSRDEIATLAKACALYKNKGLEVVGYSLDETKEGWIEGITELNMSWPQISELEYWNSKPVSDYGITVLPHTIIIDKDGRIVARNLSGEKLLLKLSQLLN